METTTALTRHSGDGAPSTALAVREFSGEEVQLIKDTVARGASDTELALFLQLARTYGLDPFAKEIWCIKYGNKAATIFTSRDGYLKIANGHPAFDGIVGDVVHENDHFQLDGEGVQHQYKFPRGKIVGAYALVFRKDRAHPAYVFAPFEEYCAGNNPTWKNYPSAMILKVAEAMALKRAFSISGLVTREELDATHPDERSVQQGRRPARFKGESIYTAGVEEQDDVQDVEAEPVEEPQQDPAQLSLDEQRADYEARAKKIRNALIGLPQERFQEALDKSHAEVADWPERMAIKGSRYLQQAEEKREALAEQIENLSENARAHYLEGTEPARLKEEVEAHVAQWPEWWQAQALEAFEEAVNPQAPTTAAEAIQKGKTALPTKPQAEATS